MLELYVSIVETMFKIDVFNEFTTSSYLGYDPTEFSWQQIHLDRYDVPSKF